MAINIKFDLVGNPEPPTIILATRNGNKLGQLDVNVDSIELIDKFNDASEFSFTLNKYIDGELTYLWDKVVDFKLVYCKEWDMWFEIKVELDEATETVKTVTCTQLGNAELSQIMLYNIEINTEKDIERDDYKISILYDKNSKKGSILDRLLEKAPHYSVVYVDPTIANIQRSFSFDDISIDDAFQEIAEEIGCLFKYPSNSDMDGSIRRDIFVYDLQQNCNECGYRGEFIDKCPKCGSTNIKYGYGDDTLIFVTSDELASDGIQFTTDTDSVKNCFKLEAGDDLMTATIRNCNPNGTDYIWYFSDNIKEDMSDELVEKIESYDEIYKQYYNDYVSDIDSNLLNNYNFLVNKYSAYNKDLQEIVMPVKGYPSLMNAYYNVIDLSLYLKSGLMPSVEISDTNAEEQASLLTAYSLSPVAVANIDTVSLSTANNAVLMIAKIIVKSTFKVQVNTSELSEDRKTWTGNFVVTNYSDEEDTSISNVISVNINDETETFIKQKIEKALNKENTDELSISGLFEKEYDNFCSELKKYALNPLISFHDACQACIDILMEQGVGDDTSSGLYKNLYAPYYKKLKAIESEIKIREDEINIISGVYDIDGNLITDGLQTNIEKCKNNIQNSLNFEKYLGIELWNEFCLYRREDKYSNTNYISDGLNNAELFNKASEFFKAAENEIYKSSELQHSISTTLNNLLANKKFKPLIESFNVGNWIRVRINDDIYKLRLLEYGINFGDFNNIPVKFSDISKIKNGITDVESILSQASSMASSYSSVQRQANQGDAAKNTIEQWLTDGLSTALVQIQNNDSEDITITKNGLLCRSYSDITETYSPKQLRLTHNILAYTDNDWESVRLAIGEHEYVTYDKDNSEFVEKIGYGINADFVTAGVVSGSQIIGGDVYSDNYSKIDATGSYLNLRDGTFSFGGGALRFEGGKLLISSPDIPTTEQITEINENYLKTTTVYAENLQVGSANIVGTLTANQIDATDLKVDVANITGILTSENIDTTNLKVDAANITGTLTIGQLPNTVAEESDIPTNISELNNDSGYQTETGVTTIIDGIVTTDYVNALGITVNAANINGKLTAKQIESDSIMTSHLTVGSVTDVIIADGAVKAKHVSADIVTADRLETANSGVIIDGSNITTGTIDADRIDVEGLITADYINTLGLTAASLISKNDNGDYTVTIQNGECKLSQYYNSKSFSGLLTGAFFQAYNPYNSKYFMCGNSSGDLSGSAAVGWADGGSYIKFGSSSAQLNGTWTYGGKSIATTDMFSHYALLSEAESIAESKVSSLEHWVTEQINSLDSRLKVLEKA